jgi:hypothetical protein
MNENPETPKKKKSGWGWLVWLLLILILVGCGWGYFKFLWVFSDGTKTGELNSLTYTGYIWKTYEGEIILSGYGSKQNNGSVTSKNFKFSVKDPEVALQLSKMTGYRVTVHYKEYKGTLPWRGYEKSIVDYVNPEPAPASTVYDEEEPLFL